LAAAASANKDLIKNAIKVNDDGTVTVRFYEKGYKKEMMPVDITVSNDVLMSDGVVRYMSNSLEGKVDDAHPLETWGPLIEKAFAAWKGGFEAIDGGYTEDATAALTGVVPKTDTPICVGANQVYQNLKQAMAKHRPMTAGTWAPGSAGGNDNLQHGLRPGHAYTILKVGEEGGKKYVELYNPQGKNPNRPTDGGVMRLPLAEFVDQFARMVY
jgi:hypothetical protein